MVTILDVKLECKNISSQKLANCLGKLSGKFPFKYAIKVNGPAVVAEFQIPSMLLVNELTRRIKHCKGIDFQYIQIEKLIESESSVAGDFNANS